MRDRERIAAAHAAANKTARAERARLEAEQKLLREATAKKNADDNAARVSSSATIAPGAVIQIETLVTGEAAATPLAPVADPTVNVDDATSSKPAVVMNTVAGGDATSSIAAKAE